MASLESVHRQDGYGAYKRKEHCEVCIPRKWTIKVGTWRAEYDDGTKRFFCDEHVSAAFAPAAPVPAPEDPQSTPQPQV